MIPELRRDFNARFTPRKYADFLARLDARCGTHVKFRNCETPCFFPLELIERITSAGSVLVRQLVGNVPYLEAARREIPSRFLAPNETPHPLFLQADFGLIRDERGEIAPRLVEIQGFPSIYAYQPLLCDVYREAYELQLGLTPLLGGLDRTGYERIMRRAIIGDHDPENVVLLEVDPLDQKTLPDFLATEKLCGVRTVDIRALRREGRKLFADGKPVERIYNRTIADELIRKRIDSGFHFSDDVDIEWAGHPNWFYLISKFSLPWLDHETVPRSQFLDSVRPLPPDLKNYVLKPLYSFAGRGVRVGPSREEIDAIPEQQRRQYLLQQRVRFEPVIETPFGATQAEIRIMYVWDEELIPCTTIIRMGRGKMMGVDHNRDLEWVGASAGFCPPK